VGQGWQRERGERESFKQKLKTEIKTKKRVFLEKSFSTPQLKAEK
jgi:hypothetical protein